MDSAAAPITAALDAKTLLARVDHRLALLRAWISHDHGDQPFWWARQTTAPRAQWERHTLRQVANLLHVERATARRRIHGTRFATLDEQATWLAKQATRTCSAAAELLRLPSYATLEHLRGGALPL